MNKELQQAVNTILAQGKIEKLNRQVEDKIKRKTVEQQFNEMFKR